MYMHKVNDMEKRILEMTSIKRGRNVKPSIKISWESENTFVYGTFFKYLNIAFPTNP